TRWPCTGWVARSRGAGLCPAWYGWQVANLPHVSRQPNDCCAANVPISLREMAAVRHLAERDEYIDRAVIFKGTDQLREVGRRPQVIAGRRRQRHQHLVLTRRLPTRLRTVAVAIRRTLVQVQLLQDLLDVRAGYTVQRQRHLSRRAVVILAASRGPHRGA